LSGSVARFPGATPNFATRNPVLYPAELRGHYLRRNLYPFSGLPATRK
jgi:hypothetical protein